MELIMAIKKIFKKKKVINREKNGERLVEG